MKKLFLCLVSLLTVTVNYAQNTLVATLSHGENVQVFYGAKALVDAHNAAENGDIITLSSGNFSIASITKAVTIRGAGMYDSEDKSIKATTISSNGSFGLTLNIPKNLSQQLIVEGVYFRSRVGWDYLENAIFSRDEHTCQNGTAFVFGNDAAHLASHVREGVERDFNLLFSINFRKTREVCGIQAFDGKR